MGYDLEKFFTLIPKRFSESDIKHIFYNMVVALNFLHSCNIIHRDLKPSNILIDEDLSVKICDFGLSRTMPDDTLESVKIRRLTSKMSHYSIHTFHERKQSNEERDIFETTLSSILSKRREKR